MAKKPKIEYYRLDLHTSNDDEVTFRSLFSSIRLSHHQTLEGNENLTELVSSNDELMIDFYRHFFQKLGQGNLKFERKNKAFSVRPDNQNQSSIDVLKLESSENYIHGIIKGGEYNTGKSLGEVDSPDSKLEKLPNGKLIADDFYFLLYTPLDKKVAVLVLQSYTKDHISDVFRPFIEHLFKISGLTLKATTTSFMPKTMQEEFKNNSIVKSFVYSNPFIYNGIEGQTLMDGDFTINVEIKSHGNQVNLSNLSSWRRKLGQAILGIPEQENRSLATFNKKKGYIKSSEGINNPTKFSLDDNDFEIKATIYLENEINLEDNGVPLWDELEEYVITAMNMEVKPEIYPEDYLNADH